MVTGRDLIGNGWPQAPVIGLALGAAEKLRVSGMDENSILRELEKTRTAPDAPTVPALEPLARELRRLQNAGSRASEHELRDEPRPYGVWGSGLIEPGTTAQMENAMRLPVSVGGALMPDAHLGYGLPVGGVLATEGTVIPWAVGVDIACRMRLSIYDVSPDLIEDRREDLTEVLLRNTNFGAGSKFKEGRRPEHEILEDPAWEATAFLRDFGFSLVETHRRACGRGYARPRRRILLKSPVYWYRHRPFVRGVPRRWLDTKH